MQRELERALKSAASIGALAEALGVSPRTVRRWRQKGVPRRGDARDKIRAERARQLALRAQQRAERELFREMMDEARERGFLPPRSRTRSWLRPGPRTVTMVHRLGLNRMLTAAAIAKIKQWAAPIRGNRPLWQGQWMFTQYAIAPPKGRVATKFTARYQTVAALKVRQLSFAQSADFGIGIQDATRQWPSKADVVGSMLEQFREMLQSPMHITYMHQVTLFNTTRRTEQERRQWQTEQRRKRQKRWERRQKKQNKT